MYSGLLLCAALACLFTVAWAMDSSPSDLAIRELLILMACGGALVALGWMIVVFNRYEAIAKSQFETELSAMNLDDLAVYVHARHWLSSEDWQVARKVLNAKYPNWDVKLKIRQNRMPDDLVRNGGSHV